MRKFNDIYKEKQLIVESKVESKILGDFKDIYSTLLTKYNIADINKLNEEKQNSFISEINTYWNEGIGITEKGKRFLETHSEVLSEHSTIPQKKNYLKNRITPIIYETIKQSGLKWKLYDIIDEMYKETKSKNISGVVPVTNIYEIIKESFSESLLEFVKEIRKELNESEKDNMRKK